MIYYTSLEFFLPLHPLIFFIGALPTGTTALFPTPDCPANTDIRHPGHLLSSPSELLLLFFFLALPSSDRSLFGMQQGDRQAAKSYTDGNWGSFLFAGSAILRCPILPSQLWRDFYLFYFPLLVILELLSTGAIRRGGVWGGHANAVPGK